MKIHVHQTHHTVGDFREIFSYCKDIISQENLNGLYLFPELFLTGYPLQDLCLQKSFINNYLQLLDDLNELFLNLKDNPNVTFLMGGLKYHFDSNELPMKIENGIYQFSPSKEGRFIYTKRLLPNYDIFDEKKYFEPGNTTTIINFQEKQIALLVCEDMWHSNSYGSDPIEDLQKTLENKKIDLIANLSASPFHIGKFEKRVKRVTQISTILKAPFVYVNRVGGEDEILFDGLSFVVNNENISHCASLFKKDIFSFDLPKFTLKPNKSDRETIQTSENSWESLFNPNIVKNDLDQFKLKTWNDSECELVLQSLKFGIQEYAKKSNMNSFVVALSGGIDSSLVLTIMKLILEKEQTLEAIFMPGLYSISESYDLSYELADKLGVKLYNHPIKFTHTALRNSFQDSFKIPLEELADENIQSRLRGTILYAFANSKNAMVLNTSNKSEIAVGYSTLYGDSVGALSVIGDLYKSEVYRLCSYINKKYNNLIPDKVISREPSAELKDNQFDTDSLPAYEILDLILEGILSYRLNKSKFLDLGLDERDIDHVFNLYKKSEFKRNQFCPIIKIKSKSFGFGYRVPITKNGEFYFKKNKNI